MKRLSMSLRIVALSAMLFVACGSPSPPPAPAPPPPPGPPPAAVSWDQARAVIVGSCQKCHNGAQEPLLSPEAVFRASSAKAKLAAGAMPPPPATISASDKQVLVSFLNQ